MIRGRCIATAPGRLTLLNPSGRQEVPWTGQAIVRVGDLVEVEEGRARILTPHRRLAPAMPWTDRVLDPRRLKATRVRSQIEAGIREFFLSRGFLETPTPLLVPCPGMETHIRTFAATGTSQPRRDYHLPTSPEFAMKRLLVGGLERIFQLAPAFRDEPRSTTHLPQFLMLEWYRAYAGYEEIMADAETLVEALAREIRGKPEIEFQGRRVSVQAPWPRLRVRDLFQEHAGVDLVEARAPAALAAHCRGLGLESSPQDTWDDLYFRIWLNVVEPKLPQDRAAFVLRYPPSQAALAVVDRDPDGTPWARRFEAYAGGIELANAFEELTDPIEQRARFAKDMQARADAYGPDFPPARVDEGFLDALTEGMPPSGGIALGVDRLTMLLADEPDIDRTVWLSY